MRITCLHGFFLIDEAKSGEISKFMSLFGLPIVPYRGVYTFAPIANPPDYALRGKTYFQNVCSTTIEARPEQIFKANGLVYDFNKGLVVPILSVTQRIQLNPAANYFLSGGLILPGSLTDEGKRVTDYAAWYLFDSAKFKYSEVTRV